MYSDTITDNSVSKSSRHNKVEDVSGLLLDKLNRVSNNQVNHCSEDYLNWYGTLGRNGSILMHLLDEAFELVGQDLT